MKWSPQQAQALDKIGGWLKDPDAPQVFRLFGYAGTGKTELARYIAEMVDGLVLAATFMGKAASVLERRGFKGASTIHQAIYKPKNKSRARLLQLEAERRRIATDPEHKPAELEKIDKAIEVERINLSRPGFVLNEESPVNGAKLLIIDECSQPDEIMGEDLCSFGCKILAMGDPMQLPPIFGAGYFTKQKPDVMLTEIHRQARDNPIIMLATRVREGRELEIGRYGESFVIPVSKCNPNVALVSDQILVGRNNTRRATNKRMRTLLGHAPEEHAYPVAGEKLVCLRNDREAGLLNGTVWKTLAPAMESGDHDIVLQLEPEDGGGRVDCTAHKAIFEGAELNPWERKKAQEFDYGYALTVHKSQGSQWDNVVLFDEWRDAATHQRWLYTGITRAAERVVVVKM